MAFALREKILNWARPWVEIPVAGLDISDRSFKYWKFRANDGAEVDFFGEVAIPAGLVVGGEILKEEELANILASLLEREGQKLRSCFIVASLPEEKSFLHSMPMPKMEKSNIAPAVRREIEANIPLPLEELVYDQEVVEPAADHLGHMDVIITAFPRKVTDVYVRVLRRAGLTPAALELESQATVRAVIPDLSSGEATAILDIGRTRTGIVIVSGGAIVFTKTVGIGGDFLTANIARALKLSPEEAERLKIANGLLRRENDDKIFSALIPACAALADEVRRAIIYYQDRARHTQGAQAVISTLLLAGGDANLRGLTTYFSSALRIKTMLADPFVSLRRGEAVPPLPQSQALAYATVMGLALRGLR